MIQTKSYVSSAISIASRKLADYSLLVKMRLSVTVVFSAVMAYAIAAGASFNIVELVLLFLGGFLITGGSNALNEVFEKDYDKLMKRTANRPLAQNRMQVPEAVLAAGIMGLSGIAILWYFFNPVAALLGGASFILYSFVYTPLKRLSPIAVFVGAIPGAMPPLIGWVCASNGVIGIEAVTLYSIQFLWQFPHFWAIGWIGYDDYQKAGFKLLPSKSGKDRYTALQCIIYIAIMIPVSLFTVFLGMAGIGTGIVLLIAGLLFLAQAIRLYRSVDVADARKLMFASIIYLPVALTALLIGSIF